MAFDLSTAKPVKFDVSTAKEDDIAEKKKKKKPEKEKSSFLQRIGIGGTPEQRTLLGLSEGAEETVFPRASETKKKNLEDGKVSFKEGAQHIASATADAFSIPGRTIAAAPSLIPGGKTFSESFAQKKATEKKGIGKLGEFAGNILRDPSTIPAALATGGVSTVGKGVLGKIALGAKAGAQEGVASAATHQIEKFGETGEVSPGEAVAEVASSTVLGGLFPALGALRAKGMSKINKLVGEVAEWTTGVQEKALRMGGKKAEREVLKKSFDKQFEIGAELVGMIDNAEQAMPDYNIIVDALEKSPSVNIIPFMNKLRGLAGDPGTAELKAVSKKIQGKVDEFSQLAVKKGDTGHVRPNDLNKFRIELDKIIGDRFGKDSDEYISALKQIRHEIQGQIQKSAKGTEYEDIITEYSKKLETLGKIKKLVGWDGKTRELRAESFIKNINNKGKTKSREWLNDFGKVFGGDFVEKADLARLADMMGPTGKGGVLPNWTTGRSNVGTRAAGLAFGSPRIASQVTLPLAEKLTKEVPKGLTFAGRQAGRVGFGGDKDKKNFGTLGKHL